MYLPRVDRCPSVICNALSRSKLDYNHSSGGFKGGFLVPIFLRNLHIILIEHAQIIASTKYIGVAGIEAD